MSGTPVFAINRRAPRPGELQAINPNEVEKVMVSRTPTAKYGFFVYGIDAGTRIRIKNYNIMIDGYNLLYKYLRTSTSYGNVFYDSFLHSSRRMLKISVSYRFNKLIEPKANKVIDNSEIGG